MILSEKKGGVLSPQFHLYNEQRDLPIALASVKKSLSTLLPYLEVECEELSLYFVTRKRISELHAEFFDDPSPTDCITFPIDPLPQVGHLGEVFVCPAVAIDYANQWGFDPYQEVTLYVIHGLLHLLGYDDLTPGKRRTMRKKEKLCMDHLMAHQQLIHPPLPR